MKLKENNIILVEIQEIGKNKIKWGLCYKFLFMDLLILDNRTRTIEFLTKEEAIKFKKELSLTKVSIWEIFFLKKAMCVPFDFPLKDTNIAVRI